MRRIVRLSVRLSVRGLRGLRGLRALDDHWLGDLLGAVFLFGLLWLGLVAGAVLQ